jgi:hypothetical protein
MDQRADRAVTKAKQGSADTNGRRPANPLAAHSRVAASFLALVAAALVVESLRTPVKSGLPSVALDWTFGLAVIRAGVAFAILAALVVFLARGWSGLWPSRISTTGIDYTELADGSREVKEASATIWETLREMVEIAKTQEQERHV